VESIVTERFLSAFGRLPVVIQVAHATDDPAPRLADVEAALAKTAARMTDDDADVAALSERILALRALRDRARAEAEAAPVVHDVMTGETFAEAWQAAEDDLARRDLLASALEEVVILPGGGRGQRLDAERVVFHYREDRVSPDDLEAESSDEAKAWLRTRYPDHPAFRDVDGGAAG
jgi:hypothetical protein